MKVTIEYKNKPPEEKEMDVKELVIVTYSYATLAKFVYGDNHMIAYVLNGGKNGTKSIKISYEK